MKNLIDILDLSTAEIDEMIRHLTEYRDAIDQEDADTLFSLLRDGRLRKEQFG